MAAQAVEYFVLLTVAGTQPEQDREDHIVLFSWAVISKSRNQVGANWRFYFSFCLAAFLICRAWLAEGFDEGAVVCAAKGARELVQSAWGDQA